MQESMNPRDSNYSRMIKHYSPSCPHCRTAAPMYQTLYEYYYVSIYPVVLNLLRASI